MMIPTLLNLAECTGSFEKFVQHYLDLHGFKIGKIQREMIHHLTCGHSKVAIHVFRTAGKSFLVDLYIIWRILRTPDIKILILSANENLAKMHIRRIKKFLKLSPITRGWKFRSITKTSIDFDFSFQEEVPSIVTLGIGAAVAGIRADLVIGDDIESRVNAKTPQTRMDLLGQLEDIINVLHPSCRFIPEGETQDPLWLPEKTSSVILGTYYSQFSIYLPPIEPGEAHPLQGYVVYKMAALDSNDESTFPERITTMELRMRRATKRVDWTLQYALDPEQIANIHGVIRWDKLVTKRVDPKTISYITLCLDPTGERLKRMPGVVQDNDELAFAIGGLVTGVKGNKNRLHILDIIGSNQHTSEDFIKHVLIPAINKWGVTRVQVESNMPAAFNLVQRILIQEKVQVGLMPPFMAKRGKHERCMNSLESNLNSGVVTFEPEVLQDRQTAYQLKDLTAISLPAHDDRIDALAQLVDVFEKNLALPDIYDSTYWGGTAIREGNLEG